MDKKIEELKIYREIIIDIKAIYELYQYNLRLKAEEYLDKQTNDKYDLYDTNSNNKVKVLTLGKNHLLKKEIIMKQEKKILITNISKIHTTALGKERIKNNLKISTDDEVEYIKKLIQNNNCVIYKQGKNYYCEINNIRLTINSYNYCIITAHIIK